MNANTVMLSIIVPVYSGESYIEKLFKQINSFKEICDIEERPYSVTEVIFVNDSPIDNSSSVTEEIASKVDWVRVIELSRNFGQHPATTSGILHSSGDWIITLDEDCQHPPHLIPKLIKTAILENKDIVYAKPNKGAHNSLFRDVSSSTFKKMMSWLTGNKNIGHISSFRLIRGQIARGAAALSEHNTYFDMALLWLTTRVSSVKLDFQDQRYIQEKRSGYSLKSLLRHGYRMILGSDLRPIKLGVIFGIFTVAISIGIGLIVLARAILFPDAIPVQGWTSSVLLQLFYGGLIIFLLSLILEYVLLIVQRIGGRPIYFTVDRSLDKTLLNYFNMNDNNNDYY